MRRYFAISDRYYRLCHAIRRNRAAVLIYALVALVFLVIGIAVGVNISDKTEYVLKNGAPVFSFLRGDSGVVAFFFIDLAVTAVYCVFTASMFFHRVAVFLSLAPCAYRSYTLGVQTCIILTVFSASSIPMLFVFFVPISIIEVAIICVLSFRCFRFAAFNGRSLPSRPELCEYYKSILPPLFEVAVCTLIKAVTLALFGSALIGVI